jgi:hypothetical protein
MHALLFIKMRSAPGAGRLVGAEHALDESMNSKKTKSELMIRDICVARSARVVKIAWNKYDF